MSSDAADKTPEQTLEAQALQLLEALRGAPKARKEQALEDFRARSERHAAALGRAQHFHALSRNLSSAARATPPRSFFRSLWYRVDLWWTRLFERPAVASLAALALAVPVVLWLIDNESTPAAAPQLAAPTVVEPARYRTDWGQQREVTLTDGSTLWLDWNTALDVQLTPERRTVNLEQGVAAFKVAPDPERPFIVLSQGSETRVLGTEFVVRQRSVAGLEVAVLEGLVSVTSPADETANLAAAQVVTIDEGRMGEVLERPLELLGQWREGKIVFRRKPLVEALRALEPYTRYTLDASRIEGHSGLVSGVFFIDQANEALFTLLQTHRLEWQGTGGNELRLRHARPQRPG
ncbi:MAG: FecR domain-containing protein [Pseudomonadota bacterium]